MGDIKFRAWDSYEGQMHIDIHYANGQPDYIGYDTNNNMVIFQPATLYDYLYDDRFVVMQFTGFKDVDGVEIYQGDLVRYTDNETGITTVNIVYRKNGTSVIGVVADGVPQNMPVYSIQSETKKGFITSFEVIGNMYEKNKVPKGV